MIRTCPGCRTRYRIDTGRVPPDGARLRCRRCERVFRVPPPPPDGQPACVVLALSDPDRAKRCRERLESAGLEVAAADDGVVALLLVQRRLPQAAVVDLELSGLEICELVKRNEVLCAIPLLLVARADALPPGGPAFAPDASLEPDDLPEGLERALRDLGIALAEPPAEASPAAPPAPEPSPPAAVSAASEPEPQAAPEPDPLADERARAERLARIVVSDIVLYNETRFAQAARAGNVVEAMEPELREGRALFASRIDARIREERDHLGEELLRTAEERFGAGLD